MDPSIKLYAASFIGSIISYVLIMIYPTADKNQTNSQDPAPEYRYTRWKKIMKMDKRVLFFDIFFTCFIIGFAYTFYLLKVMNSSQAFWGGLTAESFFCHYLSNLRKQI